MNGREFEFEFDPYPGRWTLMRFPAQVKVAEEEAVCLISGRSGVEEKGTKNTTETEGRGGENANVNGMDNTRDLLVAQLVQDRPRIWMASQEEGV